jgi:hypothetical protein
MSDSREVRIDSLLEGRPLNTFLVHHTPYHGLARLDSTQTPSAHQSNGYRSHQTESSNMTSSILSRIPSCESRVEDLRQKVQQSHWSYLNSEDTPEKLELKSKLEGLIFELLSLVPHNRKFSCLDVANCFNQTIMEKAGDFSALDAAVAFEKLEKYASNILRHPWRKEFNNIHSYGGSFKHHVGNNIVGSANILHAMGYHEKKDPSGETPRGQYVMEEVADPDKLTKVALGCMTAFVECQVMHQIQSLLKSKSNLDVSFDDIFAVRLRFVGGMDYAVKLLTESRGSASSIPNSTASSMALLSSLNQHRNAPSSQYLSKITPVSRTRSRVIPSTLSSYDSLRDVCGISYPQSSVSNGQRLTSVSSINSSFDLLDYPSRTAMNDLTLTPLSPTNQTRGQNTFSYENRSNTKNGGLNSPSSLVPPPAMFANDSPAKTRSNHLSNIEYNPEGISPVSSHLPRSESESASLRVNDYLPSITSKTKNSYLGANNTNQFQAPPVPSPPSVYSGHSSFEPIISRRILVDEVDSIRPRALENPLPIPPRSSTLRISLTPWSCPHCTFVNRRMDLLCEVCYKSRDKSGNDTPLVSGGKECSACTLVNSREATNCRACSADLSDSPTYI